MKYINVLVELLFLYQGEKLAIMRSIHYDFQSNDLIYSATTKKSITNKNIIFEIMILWIRFRQILLSVFIHLLQFSRAVCSKMSVPPSTSPPPFRYSILLCIRNSIPVPFMFHPFFRIARFLGYSQISISGASGAKI